jgi:hypothetical protein
MRIDLYGLGFETPAVHFYLWSPWRASLLETRLFEAVAKIANGAPEKRGDEFRVQIADPKSWRQAVQGVARVMKGWQEEADPGNEKRSWRWLLEADVDSDGYDHYNERACFWGFLRASVDRGNPGEGEKGEDFDLESFGFSVGGLTE